MAKDEVLLFKPQFKERIWGGNALKNLYGAAVPAGVFGEAWLVSAVPGSESVVAVGTFAGRTLSDLYRQERTLFPNAVGDFPLLTKIIDAGDRLSVQVHPGDDYARMHENQSGKSECWYVIDAAPDAELVVGHAAKTREEFAMAARDGTLERLLTRIKVAKGDFIYIPSGTLHAIGSGILLLENQQTSDVTYRLYDYNRLDAAGKPRQLHLDQGIAVTDVPAKPAFVRHPSAAAGVETLVETPFFTVRRHVVDGAFHDLNRDSIWSVATVVAGEAIVNGQSVRTGDALVVPASVGAIDIRGHCEIITAFFDHGEKP